MSNGNMSGKGLDVEVLRTAHPKLQKLQGDKRGKILLDLSRKLSSAGVIYYIVFTC